MAAFLANQTDSHHRNKTQNRDTSITQERLPVMTEKTIATAVARSFLAARFGYQHMPLADLRKKETILSPRLNPLFHPSSMRTFVLGLFLFATSLALYNPAGRHPFTSYDDDRYTFDNSHVKAGLTWQSVKWAFTSYDESNWHPITWLSHMLDSDLFRLDPAGPHYMNVLLHGVNAVLVFWVLYASTGFIWRSFMAAGLFAVHPINVETVAWIAERKNVLSLLFFLLALAAYTFYTRKPNLKRYSLVAVLFALGLMAKPQVITLPFVLLLWDYWPLQRVSSEKGTGVSASKDRPWSPLVLEKLPLFAMCIPSSILTLRAQTAAGAVGTFKRYPLELRLANGVVSYAAYLGKALWPSHLSVMYPYHPAALTMLRIVFSVFVLLSISAAVIAARRKYLIVGWFWFLGTLVPMIGIVQVGLQAMADRYAYLPFIGLFVAACWGLADLIGDDAAFQRYLAASSIVLLAALSLASRQQLSYWGSNLALWSHAAAVTQENFTAEDGIGNALLEQGDLEGAMPHFQLAAAIHPSDPISNSNLAFYKLQHGDLAGAFAQYRTVSQNAVDERARATAFINMGFIDLDLGNVTAARNDFQAAVTLRPRNGRAWIGLGVAEIRSGDFDAAIQTCSQAVSLQPTDITYVLLSIALEQSGQHEPAATALREATRRAQDLQQTRRFVNGLLGR